MKYLIEAFSRGLIITGLLSYACSLNAQNVDFNYSAVRKTIRSYNKLPIKPVRTISFTTDEGSNMNVDISPDGKTILFDMVGELFALPANGGVAMQLTRGMSVNRCPTWSPDGKYFGFISDASGKEQLHVVSKDGRSFRIIGYEPRLDELIWWPDGKSVTTSMSCLINYLYGDASDSLPRNLIGGVLIGFSSDGNFLYYQSNTTVYKLKRSSGEQFELFHWKRDSPISNIRVSPNGKWLTYFTGNTSTSMDSLMAVDLNSGRQILLSNINLKHPGFLENQHYSFSSNSCFIYIGLKGKIHRIEIETGTDQTIPFTAKVDVELGPLNYNKFYVSNDSLQVRYMRSAERRSDGKQLVFSALSRIYVMDLSDRKPRMLVDQPFGQYQPTYSPDGKFIAYVTWSDTAAGGVWVVSSNGGIPKEITKVVGHYENPTWSADGKCIVVGKGKAELRGYNPGVGDVQIIMVSSGETQTIANNVSLYNRPVFSEDGLAVYYNPWNNKNKYKTASNEPPPQPILISESVDGSKNQVVAKGVEGIAGTNFSQISLSPDKRYVVYMHNESLIIHPVMTFSSPVIINKPFEFHTGIRFASGVDPRWEHGGKILSWCFGNKYYQIKPDKIIQAAIEKTQTNSNELSQSNVIDVDIRPDAVINIDLKVSSSYAKGEVALTNVRVVTMNGNEVIENGTILVRNGKFAFIGRANNIKVTSDVEVIDLKGKTIIPGFIDLHSHMGEEAAEVFSQLSKTQLVNFAYGATTVRNPSGSFGLFGHRELLQSGQRIGPRLFSVGYAVRPDHYVLNNLEDAQRIVRNFAAYGATYIKQYILQTRMQRQWLSIASREQGINMTNEGGSTPLEDIAMLKDGSSGIEHRPDWGDVYKDLILLFSKSGTYLTPTLQVRSQNPAYNPKEYFENKYLSELKGGKFSRFVPGFSGQNLYSDTTEIKSDLTYSSNVFAKILKSGGKICLGSHGEDQGIGLHFEIWALQMGGLTNYEALETATITAAKALGMQKDLGSIEVGKIADLIILDKNPLEDIHNTNTIRYVMKAGVLYDSETLDEIWPEKKKGPTVWR